MLTNGFFSAIITNVPSGTRIAKLNIADLCKGSTADSDSVCEGSNPSSAANKKRTFVYQKFSFCLSKPQAWHIIAAQRAVHIIKGGKPPLYLISPFGAVSLLRLDDIQHFALMIYRNKLRMIYTPSA